MRTLSISLVIIALLGFSAYAYEKNSSCVRCHGDKEAMKKLGYSQLYLNPSEVDDEVNMDGISCVSCHLGDNTKLNKDDAHAGMPRSFYAALGPKYKYQAVGREITNYDPIQAQGTKRTKLLLRAPDPEKAKELGIKKITQLFYHDHDPVTMAYQPEIAQKTCGNCHERKSRTTTSPAWGQTNTRGVSPAGRTLLRDRRIAVYGSAIKQTMKISKVNVQGRTTIKKQWPKPQAEDATNATPAAMTATTKAIKNQQPDTHSQKPLKR